MQGPEWDPIRFARPFVIPLDTIQEEVWMFAWARNLMGG
jgi:hypothetical protein